VDIISSTKTGIKSSITYDGLYSIDEKGNASLRICSPLKPTIIADNLEFVTGQINPGILGIDSAPQYVIRLWEKYESLGLPLEDIAQSLYIVELTEFIRTRQYPSHTSLSEIIVLLDGINRCREITGFDKRIIKDKRKLINIVESRNKDKYNLQKNLDVYKLICAMHNEYVTAKHIHHIIPIELTNDVGKPDFRAIDSGILIDTKMRLANDKPAYEDPKDIDITNTAIFSLLMKDGFEPLQRAFDEQNTNVAMINLSISPYGFMLSTSLIADSDFRPAITTALDMVKNKEKSVIFYTIPRGTINGIYAVCFKRSVIDEIGGDLSRIDTKFRRLGSKMNFSQFAEYVNGLKPESLRDIKNGGLRIRGLDSSDIPVTFQPSVPVS